MAGFFAIVAVVAAGLAALLMWPFIGWAGLIVAPFVSSLAVVGTALLAFKVPTDLEDASALSGLDDRSVDELVADLRGMLPQDERKDAKPTSRELRPRWRA